MNFEHDYIKLIKNIIANGEYKKGRNGGTISLFGTSLTIDMANRNTFPLLLGRKMFYKGVLGEFAAFIRGPKHLQDFRDQGCNYWDLWANADESINVDYGNAWIDFNGYDQLTALRSELITNPNSRRLLITGWRPDRLDELNLPCCHYAYQWYVRQGKYLDMIWIQRSVDTMIGLPSDIILAAIWNILLAKEVGLSPGNITMQLGDTHIYEEHLPMIDQYIYTFNTLTYPMYPTYSLKSFANSPITNFVPSDIAIQGYNPGPPINFELKE